MDNTKKNIDKLFSVIKENYPDIVKKEADKTLRKTLPDVVICYLNMLGDVDRGHAADNIINELVATLSTTLHFIFRDNNELFHATQLTIEKIMSCYTANIEARNKKPYANYL